MALPSIPQSNLPISRPGVSSGGLNSNKAVRSIFAGKATSSALRGTITSASVSIGSAMNKNKSSTSINRYRNSNNSSSNNSTQKQKTTSIYSSQAPERDIEERNKSSYDQYRVQKAKAKAMRVLKAGEWEARKTGTSLELRKQYYKSFRTKLGTKFDTTFKALKEHKLNDYIRKSKGGKLSTYTARKLGKTADELKNAGEINVYKAKIIKKSLKDLKIT